MSSGTEAPDVLLQSTSAMLRIDEIKLDGRSRQHLGEIELLAESIKEIGLLHPVVVTEGGVLVAGRRRIEALKYLGHSEAPTTIVRNFEELHLRLKAERDENLCRQDVTPEEAVHLGNQLAAAIRDLSRQAQRDAGQRGVEGGRGNKKTLPQSLGKGNRHARETMRQAAQAAGMSEPTFRKAKELVESGDRTLIDEMNRTGKIAGVHRKLVVAQKVAAIAAEPPAMPEGPFRVIVVDPPWRYDLRPTDPSHDGALPYPAMRTDDIAALPVASRAHEDAILWFWTTNAHLPHAFEIVQNWGFEYKTLLTWVKDRPGTGNWLLGQTEHCLLCVRGNPTVTRSSQSTVLHAKRTIHSAKPDEFYELVEAMCPGSKFEMFQRIPREGWIGFGDEVPPGQASAGMAWDSTLPALSAPPGTSDTARGVDDRLGHLTRTDRDEGRTPKPGC